MSSQNFVTRPGSQFVQSGTAAVERTVESKLQDVVSAKDFGAVGDGVTNDKAAVAAANTYAASADKTLFFPAGTYLVNDLTIDCDWLGEEGSIIKNDGTSTVYNFIRITGKTNLRVERLTFDGSVSADPVAWNSGNYNSFTGAIALHIYNSSQITVRDCTIRNSQMSPLRIDTCSLIHVDDCIIQKGRGNFGDGVYARASSSCSITNTTISDVTRAALVTEAGSQLFHLSNVIVINAHDASINYGGGEFNAGFWFENSANHVVVGCRATTTKIGYIISTGTVAGVQSQQAHFTFQGCIANDNNTGFNMQSKAGQLPIDAKLIGCQSWGSAKGFHFEAKQTFDTFTCIGCHAEIEFTAGAGDIGYIYDGASITYPASFTFTDCTTSYKNYDQADLDSTSSNSADFSTLTAGNSNVIIRNCRNLSSQYPIVIKGRYGDLGMEISKSIIDLRTFANADLRLNVDESEIVYASVSGSGTASIEDCLISGTATIGVTGEILLDNCSVKPGINTLSVIRTLNDKKPALTIRGCRFEKNIEVDDYVLRIQEEGTNKPLTVISDCVFFNTGAATTTKTFIWNVRSGTPISYFDNVSDANVTNLVKNNTTLTNPASGDNKVTMH